MPKHVFWPVIDGSSLYAIRVTRERDQSIILRVVTSGHVTKQRWRSPIRSVVAENP